MHNTVYPHYPDLAGKTILITGAAQGIGQAVAYAFAAQEARLILIDAQSVTSAPPQAACYTADLRDSTQISALLRQIQAEQAPIDCLVHVAGVLRTGAVTDLQEADWRACFAVNVDALFHLCQALAPAMQARRSGAMICVASNAASTPRQQMAAYAASKAAALQFMRCLALEMAPYGVRCNTVSPGSTASPMLYGMGVDDAACIVGNPERFRLGIPLGRVAQGADVANSVLFLASDAARHLCMQNLIVDGGASLGG
ncbi:SDR family oxidoreductase [Massilia sp. W12]|uniref:SDR family oxidoreductase n=1 Tax=Massilia sp. W12 TaxID=3126507 RepID=UPI0030D5ECC6